MLARVRRPAPAAPAARIKAPGLGRGPGRRAGQAAGSPRREPRRVSRGRAPAKEEAPRAAPAEDVPAMRRGICPASPGPATVLPRLPPASAMPALWRRLRRPGEPAVLLGPMPGAPRRRTASPRAPRWGDPRGPGVGRTRLGRERRSPPQIRVYVPCVRRGVPERSQARALLLPGLREPRARAAQTARAHAIAAHPLRGLWPAIPAAKAQPEVLRGRRVPPPVQGDPRAAQGPAARSGGPPQTPRPAAQGSHCQLHRLRPGDGRSARPANPPIHLLAGMPPRGGPATTKEIL